MAVFARIQGALRQPVVERAAHNVGATAYSILGVEKLLLVCDRGFNIWRTFQYNRSLAKNQAHKFHDSKPFYGSRLTGRSGTARTSWRSPFVRDFPRQKGLHCFLSAQISAQTVLLQGQLIRVYFAHLLSSLQLSCLVVLV
jgi:hypothetical protein